MADFESTFGLRWKLKVVNRRLLLIAAHAPDFISPHSTAARISIIPLDSK